MIKELKFYFIKIFEKYKGIKKKEAPESTKNSLSDRTSFRKMREEQQISSGNGAGEGAEAGLGPAGWTETSTCRTTSFPT